MKPIAPAPFLFGRAAKPQQNPPIRMLSQQWDETRYDDVLREAERWNDRDEPKGYYRREEC